MSGRNLYTKEEDAHLVEFIATQCPGLSGRQGNKLYQKLTEHPKTYPWGKGHSWHSWRERYKSNKPNFDYKIVKYQRANGIVADVEEKRSSQRNAFTDDEDKLLIKYLAVHCRGKPGRCGKNVYKKLVENADKKWPWSARHPFQGWRSRYLDYAESFDLRILAYQQKHNIDVGASPLKRAANGSHSERAAKRQKVEDAYDSQEERWSRINWPSPSKNASPSKIVGPSKAVEVKVEAKQDAQIGPIASTSKEQVVNEDKHDDEDDRDEGDEEDDADESDDLRPIGSEDYHGEIFQNGTLGKSQDKVEEMSEIEEDVAGEAEIFVDDPSPALNDHPNASPEKELKEAEAFLQVRDQTEENSLVDDGPRSSLSPPQPAQLKRGNFNRNDFTMISQSRRLLNDDPFEDVPSSPYQKGNPPPWKPKHPPVIIEGTFGNRFQTATKKISRESLTEESSDDKETTAAWLPPSRPRLTKESGDKVEAEPTWPPLRAKEGRAEGVNGIKLKLDLERQAAEQRRREKGKQKAVESMKIPVEGNHPLAPLPIKSSSPPSSNALDTPEVGPSQASDRHRRATDIFAAPAPLPETMGVKILKRNSTGNIGGAMKPSSSRTINLRQELAHRQCLQQRSQTIRRSSSGASRISSSIASEDGNRILQQQEFVSQCLKVFSEQFGFSVDVVSKTWNKLQNVEQMVEVLASVKESADRRMDELMEGVSNVSSTFSKKGDNTSKSFESSLGSNKKANIDAPDLSASQSFPFAVVYTTQNDSSAVKERRNSSVGGSGSRGRKSLEIRLVDPEHTSADVEFLYHPLTGTRAGNFKRLERMGRKEEALEREQRRVSSIALSPLRNVSQQLRSQGSLEDEILGVNDDDVYEEVEIPIQDEDSDEEDVEKMDVLPVVGRKGEKMGEVGHEVEGRIIEVESDTFQPQLNGLERRYHDVEDEQSELNGTHPKINGCESVEQEIIFETDIDGTKSRSAEEVEAMVVEQTDAERWEEVEGLFRAANRSNIDMLKEIEKGFNTEFLKEWLTNKLTI